MLRRNAIPLILGSSAFGSTAGRFLAPESGCIVLIDVKTKAVIATNGNRLLDQLRVPPGSTIKPFTLEAALEAGKIRPMTAFPCPRKLTLLGRTMDCAHPPIAEPMTIETALAYSCNCFTARTAGLLGAGEVTRALRMVGLNAEAARSAELQSLGEDAISITPLALALAYRQLALRVQNPRLEPILRGLEGAVEYGTAQRARVTWAAVAGKTGSTHQGSNPLAWFCGFAPSRSPAVVVTVLVSGRRGGADAAPIAAEFLNAWHSGKL